jgi:hypothetical protein
MAGQDHVVVDVDGLAKPKDDGVAEKPSEGVATSAAAASPSAVVDVVKEEEEGGGGEEEPLIQAAECRICQEEDSVKNLEKPCACSGSLKVWILSRFGLERFSLLVVHDVHIQLDFCFLVLVLASTCTSHFISMSSGLESIKQSYGVIHNAISVPNRYCKCPCNSLFIFFLLELLAFNSYKAFICCI